MSKGINKFFGPLTNKRKQRKGTSSSSSGQDTPAKKKVATNKNIDFEASSEDSLSIMDEVLPIAPEWLQKLQSSIDSMSSRLDSQLIHNSSKLDTITEQIQDLCESNNFLEEKLVSAEKNACEAKTKVSELELKINSLTETNKELHTKLLEQESYSKKYNLKFFNIQENPKETTNELIEKLGNVLSKIDINLNMIRIDNIHRLPSASKMNPRPVIVKFVSFLDRAHIWSLKFRLKEIGSKVFITEHFNVQVESHIRKLLPIRREAIQQRMKVSLNADKLWINGTLYTVKNLHLLPPSLRAASLGTREVENHLFFFRETCPLSNFYRATFTVDRVQYSSSEQMIQSKKAILFGDTRCATAIMAETNPFEIKSIGSNIQGFNKSRWESAIPEIAKEALLAKFSQNPNMKTFLLDTNTMTLVEAAPKDKLWGIGYNMSDLNIMQQKAKWGQNLQGKSLETVREILKNI